jgi:phage regulator Rha-like protein
LTAYVSYVYSTKEQFNELKSSKQQEQFEESIEKKIDALIAHQDEQNNKLDKLTEELQNCGQCTMVTGQLSPNHRSVVSSLK